MPNDGDDEEAQDIWQGSDYVSAPLPAEYTPGDGIAAGNRPSQREYDPEVHTYLGVRGSDGTSAMWQENNTHLPSQSQPSTYAEEVSPRTVMPQSWQIHPVGAPSYNYRDPHEAARTSHERALAQQAAGPAFENPQYQLESMPTDIAVPRTIPESNFGFGSGSKSPDRQTKPSVEDDLFGEVEEADFEDTYSPAEDIVSPEISMSGALHKMPAPFNLERPTSHARTHSLQYNSSFPADPYQHPSPTESQLAASDFEFHNGLSEYEQIARFEDKAFRKALREVRPELPRKQQWYAWRQVSIMLDKEENEIAGELEFNRLRASAEGMKTGHACRPGCNCAGFLNDCNCPQGRCSCSTCPHNRLYYNQGEQCGCRSDATRCKCAPGECYCGDCEKNAATKRDGKNPIDKDTRGSNQCAGEPSSFRSEGCPSFRTQTGGDQPQSNLVVQESNLDLGFQERTEIHEQEDVPMDMDETPISPTFSTQKVQWPNPAQAIPGLGHLPAYQLEDASNTEGSKCGCSCGSSCGCPRGGCRCKVLDAWNNLRPYPYRDYGLSLYPVVALVTSKFTPERYEELGNQVAPGARQYNGQVTPAQLSAHIKEELSSPLPPPPQITPSPFENVPMADSDNHGLCHDDSIRQSIEPDSEWPSPPNPIFPHMDGDGTTTYMDRSESLSPSSAPCEKSFQHHRNLPEDPESCLLDKDDYGKEAANSRKYLLQRHIETIGSPVPRNLVDEGEHGMPVPRVFPPSPVQSLSPERGHQAYNKLPAPPVPTESSPLKSAKRGKRKSAVHGAKVGKSRNVTAKPTAAAQRKATEKLKAMPIPLVGDRTGSGSRVAEAVAKIEQREREASGGEATSPRRSARIREREDRSRSATPMLQ